MYCKIALCVIISVCIVNAQMEFTKNLLSKIKDELAFETMLLLRNSEEDCWMDLNIEYSTPIVNVNANQYFKLKEKFNSNFLAIVCLNNQTDELLRALHRNLEDMRETPTLFVINQAVDIHDLLLDCYDNRMLNVLAITNWSPEFIHSYAAFPKFKLIERRINEVQHFFEPQLKDMCGHRLGTIADNVLPRSVVYRNASGARKVAGYLLPFLQNFAKRLNATLMIRWDTNLKDAEILDSDIINRLLIMRRVDIPMSFFKVDPYNKFSYVIEMSKWQLMLPVEPELNRALIIMAAGNPLHLLLATIATILFALLLHNCRRFELGLAPGFKCLGILGDSVLRAMLYQTFVLRKVPSFRQTWIYFLLLICSLLSYNIYLAQLETLLVHPLTEPPVRSYEDMRRTGLKVLLNEQDRYSMLKAIGKTTLTQNWDVHRLVNSSMFQAMRSQPNTSYAYPITQTLWPLIERKLAKQQRVLFRLSADFTFISLAPFALPLDRNSLFEKALNRFILDTHSSGLYQLWRYRVFYKLVAIGRFDELPYECYSFNNHLRPRDLFFIAFSFLCLLGVAFVVFILELLVHAMGRLRRMIIRKLLTLHE